MDKHKNESKKRGKRIREKGLIQVGETKALHTFLLIECKELKYIDSF